MTDPDCDKQNPTTGYRQRSAYEHTAAGGVIRQGTLRFSADGKFRILMVSDIHGGRGYDADRTIRALDALIDR